MQGKVCPLGSPGKVTLSIFTMLLTYFQISYKIVTKGNEFLTVQLIAQAAYPFLFLCLLNHIDIAYHLVHGGVIEQHKIY